MLAADDVFPEETYKIPREVSEMIAITWNYVLHGNTRPSLTPVPHGEIEGLRTNLQNLHKTNFPSFNEPN